MAGLPSCHWRDRVAHVNEAELRSRVPAGVRWWETAGADCDCAARFSWYLSPWPAYQRHLLWCSFLTCTELRYWASELERWDYRPLISILLPVYRVEPRHLAECLVSVERQIYPHWEVCAVEDGSGSEEIRAALRAFATRHPGRVRLVLRDRNAGIARTSQEALELAEGEFVGLLDHDDRLAPEALLETVARLQVERDADWLYSDYDKISPEGERYYYSFKPAWSPDLLYGYCYAGHFTVLRRRLALEAGGFRPDFEGAQDFDLYLRLAELTRRVVHIPRVLYSWRQAPGSTAGDLAAKPHLYDGLRRAIDDALRRRGEPGRAVEQQGFWPGLFRIDRSGIVPAYDVVNLSRTPADGLPAGGGRRFEPAGSEAPGATLARALAEAASPYLLVLQADEMSLPEAASRELVAHLVVSGVGAVAPKIVDGDGRVDHCGLAVTPGGKIRFPLRGFGAAEACYGAYGVVARNVGAVSPLAVAFNVAALREAGGFDSTMGAAGAVVGACLGLRARGFRIVADGGITARLVRGPYDPGPAAVPAGADFRKLVLAWPSMMCGGDPYYNRSLREDLVDFGMRDEPDYQ